MLARAIEVGGTRRATLLPLCFHLLGSAPQTKQDIAGGKAPTDLWLCPKCGGPLMVIERLTAPEIQLRSPRALVTEAARNDSLPQEIFACVSALSLSTSGHSANRALLLSQPCFGSEFCAFVTFSILAGVCRALPHGYGASRAPNLPTIEFA